MGTDAIGGNPGKPRIKSAERSETEEQKRHKFFMEIAIKGSNILRKRLGIGEESYASMWGPSTGDPKSYFLFGALNEAEKAGVSMMFVSEYVVDSRAQAEKDLEEVVERRISNNIFQTSIDEMSVWQRKLTELMVDLVGFRRVNSQDYYRHYITLHELVEKRRIQKDFREFYECDNKNLGEQVRDLEEKADTLAAKLDPKKCWYAKVDRGVIKRQLRNFEERFNVVFPHMKEAQKAILRTYGTSFGKQSAFLHPAKSASYEELSLDDLDAHIGRIGLLVLHVVGAAKDLMRIHNTKGYLKALSDVVKKNDYPIALFRKTTRPSIQKGDFVLAYGDLGRVTKVTTSSYGYRCFRVRYLSAPPLPHLLEDEFPADYIHLLYKRKPIIDQMREEIARSTPGVRPSTRALNKAAEDSVKHLWSIGFKEIALGDPEAGYEKIRLYLEERKKGKSGFAN